MSLLTRKTLLARDPNDAAALLTKSRRLAHARSTLESLDFYEKGLRACAGAFGFQVSAVADALVSLGRNDEAYRLTEELLANSPVDDSAKWMKSLLCLSRGELDIGWELYEARWAAPISKAAAVGRRYSRVCFGKANRSKATFCFGASRGWAIKFFPPAWCPISSPAAIPLSWRWSRAWSNCLLALFRA